MTSLKPPSLANSGRWTPIGIMGIGFVLDCRVGQAARIGKLDSEGQVAGNLHHIAGSMAHLITAIRCDASPRIW
jgi:hypothetical protein